MKVNNYQREENSREKFLAVLSRLGDAARDGPEQLDDVCQMILVSTVVLALDKNKKN